MKNVFPILFFLLFLNACSGENDTSPLYVQSIPNEPQTYQYLALGDSYTIGQSVCESCRFPMQLTAALETEMGASIRTDIIAQTGWTTTNLLTAIANQNPSNDYDLVTLLIGVNNQYQHKPFSLYEQEFPQLVNQAIAFAQGDKSKVIVVSIPDYAFTPFGQNSSDPTTISTQIDQYNAFAKNYCESQNIAFINITDITRNGLDNPALVASDGLHPSQLAYTEFVERIFPKAMVILDQ